MDALFIQNTTFTDLLCLTCFLGAIGQEILHWFNLKLELKEDVKFYTSKTYWIITVISICFFGLTTKLLANLAFKDENLSDSILFVTAFSYPMILKQVLKLITKRLDNNNPRSKYATKSTYNRTFKIKDYLKNF